MRGGKGVTEAAECGEARARGGGCSRGAAEGEQAVESRPGAEARQQAAESRPGAEVRQ